MRWPGELTAARVGRAPGSRRLADRAVIRPTIRAPCSSMAYFRLRRTALDKALFVNCTRGAVGLNMCSHLVILVLAHR